MGRKEKLRERFLKLPSDFTFDEMQSLLMGYGYEKSDKGRTSGSRVIFKNGNKRPIMAPSGEHCERLCNATSI